MEKKTKSEQMMGNQIARKREAVLSNRDRFLGALWNALNCSTTNNEVIEIMETLKVDRVATRMREIYLRSKKGTREQALEDIKAYRSFK